MNIAVLILRIKKAEVSNGSDVREGGSTVKPAGARRARNAWRKFVEIYGNPRARAARAL